MINYNLLQFIIIETVRSLPISNINHRFPVSKFDPILLSRVKISLIRFNSQPKYLIKTFPNCPIKFSTLPSETFPREPAIPLFCHKSNIPRRIPRPSNTPYCSIVLLSSIIIFFFFFLLFSSNDIFIKKTKLYIKSSKCFYPYVSITHIIIDRSLKKERSNESHNFEGGRKSFENPSTFRPFVACIVSNLFQTASWT